MDYPAIDSEIAAANASSGAEACKHKGCVRMTHTDGSPARGGGGAGAQVEPGPLLNLFDYEANAERVLSRPVWDWLAGGSMDEVTLRRNRTAFESITLRPRFLRDIGKRDLATTVLGTPISLPVMISPAGQHGQAHPDGEKATARGAGRAGTVFMAPTSSTFTLEDVSKAATGPLWFQLYHHAGESEGLARRAEAAGYSAIVLSVDAPASSPKERDLRHGVLSPALSGLPSANVPQRAMSKSYERGSSVLTWSDLEWLRNLTKLPLVLKGILTAEDATMAVEQGVDAIVVSNHGGRLLDGPSSTIEALPEVVAAVGGRAEVYLDSGIRRGTDVLKALALGARAVSIGRPLFWGLAARGADGVHQVLEILREELSRAMAFCGQTSVRELEPGIVRVPASWQREFNPRGAESN